MQSRNSTRWKRNTRDLIGPSSELQPCQVRATTRTPAPSRSSSRRCATRTFPPRSSRASSCLMLDSLGCALYGSRSRMEPHPADDARQARHDQSLPRLGHGGTAVGAARRARQRHADPELRARRRAPPGRAACRRGHAAAAGRRHRAAPRPAAAAISSPRRSPATRSARASANAWARSISAKAGTPARRSECFRRRPARLARSASPPSRPCTRSASPARNPQG